MLHPFSRSTWFSATKRGATSILKKKSEIIAREKDENFNSGETSAGKKAVTRASRAQLSNLKKTTRITQFNNQQSPEAENTGGTSSVEEEHPETQSTKQKQPGEPQTIEKVTFEKLKACWDEFARKKQVEGKSSDITILKQEISLDEDGLTIHLPLMNSLQKDLLSNFRQELMDYLRNQLNNSKIQLNPYIVEQSEQEKKYYTPEEKFNYLMEKYPILQKMKDKLGLDPEF